MFYRKSDIEVLCETLLKLVDKHDKAVKTSGVLGAVPHQKSIEIVMKRIEADLQKPIIGVESKIKTSAKKFLEKGENEVKRFSGIKKKKPNITVVHGASDDIKPHDVAKDIAPDPAKSEEIPPTSPQKENISLDQGLNKLDEAMNTPDPVKPTVPAGIITPDNIDSMADQLST